MAAGTTRRHKEQRLIDRFLLCILAWHGAWRSPVAHLNGVQGVVGSNPTAPTSSAVFFPPRIRWLPDCLPCLLFHEATHVVFQDIPWDFLCLVPG